MTDRTGDRIRIVVDPDLADYIPQYLENRMQDLLRMEAALDAGELRLPAEIGHKIRGAAGGYGFGGLGELATALEAAAKAGDLARARSLVATMRDYLSRVDVVNEGA